MSHIRRITMFAVTVCTILAQETVFALNSGSSKYQVYYDDRWLPVPLLTATNVSTVARTPQRRYGLLPCECAELQCGCCVNTNFFSTQRSGCMNMTYDPQEFAIGMNMLWNGDSVYQNSISAKNPPPACMEAPIPYLPSIQFCIKLFDIHTLGRNIHMCVNFETRVARAPILILEFDCIEMGVDGVDHVKFNTTQSPPTDEIASDFVQSNTTTEGIASDFVQSNNTTEGILSSEAQEKRTKAPIDVKKDPSRDETSGPISTWSPKHQNV